MDKKEVDKALGEFEGEVYLSTDGKHTVHFKATSPEGRTAGGEWAFGVYQKLAEKLGTKADMWAGKINGGTKQATIPVTVQCEQCGGEAEKRSGVNKRGKPYSGIFCQNEDCKYIKWLSTKK